MQRSQRPRRVRRVSREPGLDGDQKIRRPRRRFCGLVVHRASLSADWRGTHPKTSKLPSLLYLVFEPNSNQFKFVPEQAVKGASDVPSSCNRELNRSEICLQGSGYPLPLFCTGKYKDFAVPQIDSDCKGAPGCSFCISSVSPYRATPPTTTSRTSAGPA